MPDPGPRCHARNTVPGCTELRVAFDGALALDGLIPGQTPPLSASRRGTGDPFAQIARAATWPACFVFPDKRPVRLGLTVARMQAKSGAQQIGGDGEAEPLECCASRPVDSLARSTDT